jgi:hypothetical protein
LGHTISAHVVGSTISDWSSSKKERRWCVQPQGALQASWAIARSPTVAGDVVVERAVGRLVSCIRIERVQDLDGLALSAPPHRPRRPGVACE